MAILRPEYGPSLPEVLHARHGWPMGRTRRLLIAVAVLIILVQAVRAFGVTRSSRLANDVVVPGRAAFTLGHRDELERVAPAPGELLRLTSAPDAPTDETFTVTPLKLEPFTGDLAGVWPLQAAREVARLRASFPVEFRFRGDRPARINRLPGHQLRFQARIDGRLHYGKRFLLLPAVVLPEDPDAAPPPQPLDGAVLTLLSRYSKATPNVDAVGDFGLMKGPLRSFRFGTERP